MVYEEMSTPALIGQLRFYRCVEDVCKRKIARGFGDQYYDYGEGGPNLASAREKIVELKEILATREHVLSIPDRRAIRMAKIANRDKRGRRDR